MRPWVLCAVLAASASGCMKFDPKSATFYREPGRPMSQPTKHAGLASSAVESKFVWRTSDPDPHRFIGLVAGRAPSARVPSSRLNDSVELSFGNARLRITALHDEILYECWSQDEMSCRELLASVLAADAP
jgi:hypothetical protein